MSKENLKQLEPGALVAQNPIVQASESTRSASPGNTFPGNRLPGTSGTTSASATVATGDRASAAPSIAWYGNFCCWRWPWIYHSACG